jgi:hypothetical protein
MKTLPQRNRTTMTTLLVVAGLFMVTIAPFLIQSGLDATLQALVEEAAANPQHASGPNLVALSFPLWRALIFVVGVVAIAITYPLSKGADWAWPAALACLAVPAIGGMTMTLPHIARVGDTFPPSMIVTLVGLMAYFSVLLLGTDRGKKGIDVLVFTLLGVVTTLGFVLGLGGLGQFMARPDRPLFVEAKTASLSLSGPVSGISMALAFAAVPLLALREPAGWWLGVIGGASIFTANVPTFVVSHSLYYLMGATAGLLLTVTLLVTAVKRHLVGPLTTQVAESKPVSKENVGAEHIA